ncbi:hypothetical protein [Hyphomicrobium sp.]|uniref:hypothetical protein n=1 Tax=Hyphomicrobium sp. TaxID=82 RepID=UPI002E31097B|nr:hypothetical protein [Hyphomicrobium sp.]HEX2840611.1 hypothetical protein [Hyphomicrobium sp.]
MPSISSVNSTAVLILQQTTSTASSTDTTKQPGNTLLAVANGVYDVGAGPQAQARKKVSEALFDASKPNAMQMKIDLMHRLGDEFGISMDDFESASQFGAAIRDEIGKIKLQEGGALALAAIEKKLGLDKLGISLDELVSAIIDPEGDEAEKLDAALTKKLGEDARDGTKDTARVSIAPLQRDELGLYGF